MISILLRLLPLPYPKTLSTSFAFLPEYTLLQRIVIIDAYNYYNSSLILLVVILGIASYTEILLRQLAVIEAIVRRNKRPLDNTIVG